MRLTRRAWGKAIAAIAATVLGGRLKILDICLPSTASAPPIPRYAAGASAVWDRDRLHVSVYEEGAVRSVYIENPQDGDTFPMWAGRDKLSTVRIERGTVYYNDAPVRCNGAG